MAGGRIAVALETWNLGRRARVASTKLRRAQLRAGEAVQALADCGGEESGSAALSQARASVASVQDRIESLRTRLALSLDSDRRDYKETSSEWGRWLVVVRGALDRLVLREEARRARRELPGRLAQLGELALLVNGLAERVPADVRAEVELARESIARLQGEREALLAPYGGKALPDWLGALAREGKTLLDFVRAELTKKLFLRLPALAAMIVAWWLSQRYTSSWLTSGLDRISGRDRHFVSEVTLERLRFWLPLLCAAVVAYLTTHVSKTVRRIYLQEDVGK